VVLAIAACVPLALIWAFNTLGANIAYSLWNVLAIVVIIVCTRLVIKFDDAETLND
jgi:multidrug transporter EmrE-like cation transporter